MLKKLPLYKALINGENEGMLTISLVDFPAVESDWVAFEKQSEKLNFKIENEEQRAILGVVMRADFPIYRIDPSGYEFYIEYDADTIRQMAQKYLKDGFQNNVSLMHNGELVEGVEMQEIFIKNEETGINPKGFEDIADGSLFARFKVENDDIWKEIKEGKFKGFSLEGYFNIEKVKDPEEQEYNEILDMLNKINNKLKNK